MGAEAGSFYVPLGEGLFRATELTASPWGPGSQHGGPPTALLGRTQESDAGGEGSVVARLAFEFLGPVPVGTLRRGEDRAARAQGLPARGHPLGRGARCCSAGRGASRLPRPPCPTTSTPNARRSPAPTRARRNPSSRWPPRSGTIGA